MAARARVAPYLRGSLDAPACAGGPAAVWGLLNRGANGLRLGGEAARAEASEAGTQQVRQRPGSLGPDAHVGDHGREER
jgi:hypothetical protein